MITAQILNKLAALKLKPEQMAGVLAILAEIAKNQEDAIEILNQRKDKDKERKRKSRGQSSEFPRTSSGISEDSPGNVRGQNADGHSDGPPDGSDGFPHPSLTSLTSPIEKPLKGQKEKPQKTTIVFPEWVPADLGEDYLEVRRVKRATRKQSAIDRIMSKCEKFCPENPASVLEQSVNGNWIDVFELKTQGAKHGKRTTGIHGGFEQQDYFAGTEGFRVTGEDPRNNN